MSLYQIPDLIQGLEISSYVAHLRIYVNHFHKLSRFRVLVILATLFRPPLGGPVGGPVLLLGDVVPELSVLEEVGVAPHVHLVPARLRLKLRLNHALPGNDYNVAHALQSGK